MRSIMKRCAGMGATGKLDCPALTATGKAHSNRRSKGGVYHGTQGTSMRIDLSPKIKDDGGYGEHF